MYIVWIDILRSDDRYSAYLRSTEFDDPRVTYMWDRYKLTGVEWQDALDVNNLAWDVYFLYGPDAAWGAAPAKPGFWMHQLGFPPEVAPPLNQEGLTAKIAEMLEEVR